MEAVATVQQPGLVHAAKSVSTAWDLLVAITVRDLKVRYQGTVLSFLWWIARPLALGLVLFFALDQVLRLGIPNYAVFLLSALFPWFWFSGSVQQATGTFVNNNGLIKKVQFPRLILPLSAVFFNTVQFALTLPILIIFVLVSGVGPDATWLIGIPLLFVLQFVLLVGLGTLLATLNVFFRDLGPMVEVVLLLMFYLSPIIYSLDRVPDRFRPFLLVNPLAPLVDAWRNLFLNGALPDADLWPTLLLTTIVVGAGFAVFRRLERYFADAF